MNIKTACSDKISCSHQKINRDVMRSWSVVVNIGWKVFAWVKSLLCLRQKGSFVTEKFNFMHMLPRKLLKWNWLKERVALILYSKRSITLRCKQSFVQGFESFRRKSAWIALETTNNPLVTLLKPVTNALIKLFGDPLKIRLQGLSRSFKPFGNAMELLIRNSLKTRFQ